MNDWRSDQSKAEPDRGGAEVDTLGVQRSFDELNEAHPCQGCPAPCCRVQLSPYKTPATFTDIDHVRFTLQFPATELTVAETGEWSILRWGACVLLDDRTCSCSVHGTSRMPKICIQYNPHDCWYKRNLVTEEPVDIYRLTLRRFDVWVREITFDEAGRITAVPSFERSREILRSIPPEVVLTTDERWVK